MKTDQLFTILSTLDTAINHFFSREYYLAAKFSISADYGSSILVNEPFLGQIRMDNAANTAMMIAMTMHGIAEINSMGYNDKQLIYHSIQNQWLKDYHYSRDLIISEHPNTTHLFNDDEYRCIAMDSIVNTIANIILGRFQLPVKINSIYQFCEDAGMSNPYINISNWHG